MQILDQLSYHPLFSKGFQLKRTKGHSQVSFVSTQTFYISILVGSLISVLWCRCVCLYSVDENKQLINTNNDNNENIFFIQHKVSNIDQMMHVIVLCQKTSFPISFFFYTIPSTENSIFSSN